MKGIGTAGAIWATVGVLALLGFAIYRLAPIALDAHDAGMSSVEYLMALAFCVFMAYSEGYRGFQKSFSPRTAARIRYLRDRPSTLHSVLGPVFAMGFFHANRRTKIVAYCLSTGLLMLVLTVRLLHQPWRGIIDAGVVLGLTWGMVSLIGSLYSVFSAGGQEREAVLTRAAVPGTWETGVKSCPDTWDPKRKDKT